jgi:hypothetical protein
MLSLAEISLMLLVLTSFTVKRLFNGWICQLDSKLLGFGVIHQLHQIHGMECPVTTPIADAKYIAVDVHDVVKQQTHLSSTCQNELLVLLLQFTDLFSGKLGCYPHKESDLQLIPNATPKHHHAYPVPRAHEQTFRREIECLLSIGVLIRVGASEWASPTFIIPNKDGQVHSVSNFHHVNSQIK